MRRSQTKAASEAAAKQAEGGGGEARVWQATVSSDKTKRGYGFVVGHFATEIEVPTRDRPLLLQPPGWWPAYHYPCGALSNHVKSL